MKQSYADRCEREKGGGMAGSNFSKGVSLTVYPHERKRRGFNDLRRRREKSTTAQWGAIQFSPAGRGTKGGEKEGVAPAGACC